MVGGIYIPKTGERVRSLWLPRSSSQVNQQSCPLDELPNNLLVTMFTEPKLVLLEVDRLQGGSSLILLVFMLFDDSLPLSVGRRWDFLLTHRILQRWCDVTPVIMFYYIRLHLASRLALETLLADVINKWPYWGSLLREKLRVTSSR